MSDKENLWNKAIDSLEKIEVPIAAKMGGQNAAYDQKMGLEALRQGHILEENKYAFKLEGDIVSHVTGHDKPMDTPASKTPAAAPKVGK